MESKENKSKKNLAFKGKAKNLKNALNSNTKEPKIKGKPNNQKTYDDILKSNNNLKEKLNIKPDIIKIVDNIIDPPKNQVSEILKLKFKDKNKTDNNC